MTKHPLTDKKAFKKFWDHTVDLTTEVLYTSDGIRAAADWQLEQDQKRLKDFLEEFSYRGHSSEVILELRAFFNNFKSYMRPTKEKNK